MINHEWNLEMEKPSDDYYQMLEFLNFLYSSEVIVINFGKILQYDSSPNLQINEPTVQSPIRKPSRASFGQL